jgi:hypothetical protein
MEIIIVVLVVVIVFSLIVKLDHGTRPADNREPYMRDAGGQVWALKVGDGTSHEEFIHDGTPHQNPAVREETRWRLWIFPYSLEVSYYPITVSGRNQVNLEAIQARVDDGRRRGRDVELVTLDARLEREVIKRENGTQLDRDVPGAKLAYKLNGKPRVRNGR